MLPPGTRLGPYEILSPLGEGGMGVVYVARDSRLDRKVALKVLPDRVAKDALALARFEREAKALAALNHPAILSIHDFGTAGELAFAVMELLEGETLREALKHGPLLPRRVAELGAEVARGLAAAHDKGLIHRDLKPENLFLTSSGTWKILDFGLAKSLLPLASPEASDTHLAGGSDDPTLALGHGPASELTQAGVLLGTMGYFAPEQIRGLALDSRADLFTLGIVLYECLLGEKPFKGGTNFELLSAILKDEVPELPPDLQERIPKALEKVIRHCLEKEPSRRYQSARDLAFALESVEPKASTRPIVLGRPRPGPNWRNLGLGLLLVGLGVGVGVFLPSSGRTLRGEPSFHPITQERGTLQGARFIPGTSDVVYSASWGADPARLYTRPVGKGLGRAVPEADGLILSVSPAGEALGLMEPMLSHGCQVGRLFSVSLAGGAPREWVEDVWAAEAGKVAGDFAAVLGKWGGNLRLEWPLGRTLLEGPDLLRSPRIQGDRLAVFRDAKGLLEDGHLLLLDRSGNPRVLAPLEGFTGMAWGPGGQDLWVSTFRDGESTFLSVDLSGRTRTLLKHAGRLELVDVEASGRVLAIHHTFQRQAFGGAAGGKVEQDLGWMDAQTMLGLTLDQVLLGRVGDWSRSEGHLYLRPLTGGPAKDMGGLRYHATLSQDGRWIATFTDDPLRTLVLVPTGPGAPRTIPIPEFSGYDTRAELLPDGKSALLWGVRDGKPFAWYRLDLDTGACRSITPDGANFFVYQTILSPDAQWMEFNTPRGHFMSRTDGQDLQPVKGIDRRDAVSGWTADSRGLILFDRNRLPAPVTRLDPATGSRTPLLALRPADPVGISGIQGLQVARDGRTYAYNVVRKLSTLYRITGLK
jgi:serine/threonine protein kinase